MISQQNSQDQEGFIAVKLVQKVSEVDDIRDSKGKQCKPFSPFCLLAGQGHLRMQIPQSLDQIQEFQIEEQRQSETAFQEKTTKGKGMNRNNSNTVTLQHPYRLYVQNPAYQLVYSKNSSEEPILNEFQYIKNEIILQTSQKTQNDKLEYEKKHELVNRLRNPYSKLLRSFDYAAVNQMPRNNSSKSEGFINQLLVFDSRFESGNLYCAYNKIGTNQYHLFVQNDTNSYGYNQWFYYSLSNMKKDIEYTFSIVNFKKRNSFFRCGYKPIAFSLKKYEENGSQNGWYRTGYDIDYSDSNISTSKFFKFYKLTFTLKFQHDKDYVLIAANLPYSFSRLSNYLQRFAKQFHISNSQEEVAHLKITALGRTFCGNNVPQIKISPCQEIRESKSPSKSKKKDKKDKKMIIFLARQHPGETVSSFLMQSLLQQLSMFGLEPEDQKQKSSKQKIKYLLKNYVIVMFPMVNIDGVIYGNSRCDVSGMDLNRRWKNPSKIFHPQISNIKNKLQSYARKYDIVGCFDLHGHSKLYNVFCYSCKINPITCRILPYIISKETKMFNFLSCTFGITRYKSTTARASIFKTVMNQNVLTIEASYFGFIQNANQNIIGNCEKKGKQIRTSNLKKTIKYFQPKTFHQIAIGILNGLQIFLNRSKSFHDAENEIKSHIEQILSLEKLTHDDNEESGSGSESDPEGDEIDFQTKINTILGKQFFEEANSFMPAEEQMIDVPQQVESLSSAYIPKQSLNLKTELKTQTKVEINGSTQKVEHLNKIRITKIKPDIANRKTFSSQKLKSQLNIINTSVNKNQKSRSKKETPTYSFQNNFKETLNKERQKRFNSTYHQQVPNSLQGLYSQTNHRTVLGLRKNQEINKTLEENREQNNTRNLHQPSQDYDDLIIYSADSKDILSYEKSNLLERTSMNSYKQLAENDFFLKFQKFFPSHQMASSNKKQKLSFLQESIYKDDQRQILNTLMQNKKRIDQQKIKRQSDNINVKEKSNIYNNKQRNVWKDEKQTNEKTIGGVIGSNAKKKQDVVDFRTFKDRQKFKMQLRQANNAYTKYMKKDGFL